MSSSIINIPFLPDDIWMIILDELDVWTLHKLARCCTRLRDIVNFQFQKKNKSQLYITPLLVLSITHKQRTTSSQALPARHHFFSVPFYCCSQESRDVRTLTHKIIPQNILHQPIAADLPSKLCIQFFYACDETYEDEREIERAVIYKSRFWVQGKDSEKPLLIRNIIEAIQSGYLRTTEQDSRAPLSVDNEVDYDETYDKVGRRGPMTSSPHFIVVDEVDITPERWTFKIEALHTLKCRTEFWS